MIQNTLFGEIKKIKEEVINDVQQKKVVEKKKCVKKSKKENEIQGKNNYGKRFPITFYLNEKDFIEASKFFEFTGNHDEPNSEKLMKIIKVDGVNL
jgi:hypothetical protein